MHPDPIGYEHTRQVGQEVRQVRLFILKISDLNVCPGSTAVVKV